MSNPTVNVAFANPDPATTVSDLQGLVTELNSLISGSLTGDFVPYVVSSTTPSVSDQDKIWMQPDAAGRPIAIKKFYNGTWRRFYNGNTDEVKIFIGDPGQHFDTDGLGNVGGEWDGWKIMNGVSISENWSNLFPVGGQMDNVGLTGYDSGWQTNITGTAKKTSTDAEPSGNADYTLTNNNLPSMKVYIKGNSSYDNNGGGNPIQAIVTGKTDGSDKTAPDPIASFGADPTGNPVVPQVAIPTVPPFAVVCWCKWVGYA